MWETHPQSAVATASQRRPAGVKVTTHPAGRRTYTVNALAMALFPGHRCRLVWNPQTRQVGLQAPEIPLLSFAVGSRTRLLPPWMISVPDGFYSLRRDLTGLQHAGSPVTYGWVDDHGQNVEVAQ